MNGNAVSRTPVTEILWKVACKYPSQFDRFPAKEFSWKEEANLHAPDAGKGVHAPTSQGGFKNYRWVSSIGLSAPPPQAPRSNLLRFLRVRLRLLFLPLLERFIASGVELACARFGRR